jgi:hypothetical protein
MRATCQGPHQATHHRLRFLYAIQKNVTDFSARVGQDATIYVLAHKGTNTSLKAVLDFVVRTTNPGPVEYAVAALNNLAAGVEDRKQSATSNALRHQSMNEAWACRRSWNLIRGRRSGQAARSRRDDERPRVEYDDAILF